MQFALPGQPRTYSLAMTPPLQGGGTSNTISSIEMKCVQTKLNIVAMQDVEIDADFRAPGTERQGFFFNANGLQWNPPAALNTTFGGWIACMGTHGTPQLFWQTKTQKEMDQGCVDVNIVSVQA